MPRGRTASRSTRADFGANQTTDFEQIVVERIDPSAEPQASIQAGDGRILIEKTNTSTTVLRSIRLWLTA